MDRPPSRSDRETLKAIYRLTRGARPPRAAAHTGALADSLGVSPGTATSAVKRLAEAGLLEHIPYRGVELTAPGRRMAVAAIRRHRIVERFLADMLGYAWNEADRLAGSFEHELPQEVEDRIYVALNRPTTCPHGFPIPDQDVGDIPEMPPVHRSRDRRVPGHIGAASRCPRGGEGEASLRRSSGSARRRQGAHDQPEGCHPDLRPEGRNRTERGNGMKRIMRKECA